MSEKNTVADLAVILAVAITLTNNTVQFFGNFAQQPLFNNVLFLLILLFLLDSRRFRKAFGSPK